MNYKILKNITFNDIIQPLKLNDIILSYDNGINRKNISINVFNKYPLIYDKKYDRDITIYFCPNTYFCVLLYGLYTIHDIEKDFYNNLSIVDENGNIIIPLRDFPNFTNLNILIEEVKIMTIKNVITTYNENLFCTKHSKKIMKLHDISYLMEVYNGKRYIYHLLKPKDDDMNIKKNGIHNYNLEHEIRITYFVKYSVIKSLFERMNIKVKYV